MQSTDHLPCLMDADPDMVSAMEPWLTQLGTFREEVIGEAKYEMTGERSPGVRTEEAAMGNYITDALRYYVDTYRQDLVNTYGDIDFVVQNGGGIRAGLGVGDVTVNNIMTILPFGNVFSIIRLTGAKVMETLEQSVSGVEDAEGRFLQVSGIRYGFNQSQPVGSRVVFAHLETDDGWVPVDDDKSYNLLCANFIANGGDGYESLTSSELIFEYGNTLSDTVIEVTKEWALVDYSPESLGNRIMNCTATPEKCTEAVSSATAEEVSTLARTVTFLHTNDNHAHIEPMNKYGSDCAREDWEGCFGGYARMKVSAARLIPCFPAAAAAAPIPTQPECAISLTNAAWPRNRHTSTLPLPPPIIP